MLDSLFVSKITPTFSTDFHKIGWKGGTLAMEETTRIRWNPDHVTLGLGFVRVTVTVRCGTAILRMAECVPLVGGDSPFPEVLAPHCH